MTALEILKRARDLCGSSYEWQKWEDKRQSEKQAVMGETLLPMVEWALRTAGKGEITEYAKALAAVRVEIWDCDKWASEKTHAENLAALDRAIKALGG